MEATARHPISRYLLVFAFLAAGVLLFARAMDRDLNHDEHQFLAPGALLTRQHVLPYRDYPLFHLSNLTYIYASLLRVTNYYVLGAKLLSVLASTAVLGAVLLRATRRTPFGADSWRVPIGLALALLLITDPLFLWTSGKTWNHEIPAMLLVAAYLCQVTAIDRNSLVFSSLSGFLVSLAVGTRLTVLPALLPFAATFLLPRVSISRRLALFTAFTTAGIIGAAPSLYSFFTARDAFLFGNFEFPRLRLLDTADSRAADTATWWRKLRYFFKEIVMLDRKDEQFRGSLLLFAVFLGATIPVAWQWLRDRRTTRSFDLRRLPAAFSAVLVLFVSLGCALPTRYQYQHWFIVVPFLALAIAEALPFVTRGAFSWKAWAIVAIGLASLLMNGRTYLEPASRLLVPREWYAIRLHAYGDEMRSHTTGQVLTLAPAYAIDAGLPIYPEFATGPFAWRLAHLLPPEKRLRFHVIAPADLESFLSKKPPAAILTGVDDDELEEPLISYAKAHGYQQVRLKKKRDLWLKPTPAPL
jgi:hypothetical protein